MVEKIQILLNLLKGGNGGKDLKIQIEINLLKDGSGNSGKDSNLN